MTNAPTNSTSYVDQLNSLSRKDQNLRLSLSLFLILGLESAIIIVFIYLLLLASTLVLVPLSELLSQFYELVSRLSLRSPTQLLFHVTESYIINLRYSTYRVSLFSGALWSWMFFKVLLAIFDRIMKALNARVAYSPPFFVDPIVSLVHSLDGALWWRHIWFGGGHCFSLQIYKKKFCYELAPFWAFHIF